MSKSVPDQKVEDVLSSVRRLVSSELPRKPRAAVPEGPGALVLTEAHRVESDRQAKAKSHSLEDRIAELEAAVGGQGDEFEPDGSEDQAQHRPDRIVYTRPPNSSEEAAMRKSSVRLSQIALIETGPANDDPAAEGEGGPAEKEPEGTVEFRREVTSRSPDPTPAPEAPIAEDVPAEPPQSAEVKAFTNPDDVVANIEARIASGRPISEPLPLGEPLRPAEEEPTDDGEDFDTALNAAVAASIASSQEDTKDDDLSDDADHAEDVLAAEEFDPGIFSADTPDPQVTAAELLGDPEDTVEDVSDDDVIADMDVPPDVAKEDAPSRSEPEEQTVQADAVETASVGETGHTSESPSPAVEPAPATGDAIAALAALPDEEAMRLLIARMIRDELQGDLGERITRNVRKLVRREIKRALTSKDLS